MSQELYWDRSCTQVSFFLLIISSSEDLTSQMRGTLVTGGNLLLDCNLQVSSQRAESETPQGCLPLALLRIREAFLSSTARCALQYKWFLRGKRKKKNKRKLIKCLLADPFNTNNVTRSMAAASAESPGQQQGHRPPCTLTGIYLQRSWISPNAESSQVPLNFFKINSSWTEHLQTSPSEIHDHPSSLWSLCLFSVCCSNPLKL